MARDFDEDGYTDLAASVFEGCGPHVIIMWGSDRGLTRAARVPGTDGSHVPWATEPCLEEQLAAGDFDGDGHADLVFGIGSERGLLKGPFLRDGSPADTGRVPVPRVPDEMADDVAYQELVAGDLDGDGIDDLVVLFRQVGDAAGGCVAVDAGVGSVVVVPVQPVGKRGLSFAV